MTTKPLTLIVVILIAAPLLFGGCGGNYNGANPPIDPVALRAQQQAANLQRLNQLMIDARMSRPPDPSGDYIIGPEDLLEIDVLMAEDLKREVRVNYRGYIGLPVVGQVMAKGLTPGQLEQELSKRLEKYLKEPVVSVYVKEYKSQKILVTGAVGKPGIYSVVGQKYLIDMLFTAEGLREHGRSCYIFRPLAKEPGREEASETLVVDLSELIEKGDRRFNIPVFSGDVIHVPAAGSVYVDGAVRKRGLHKLVGRTTLVRAIALSEGFRFVADQSDVKILRDTGTGARQVIQVDYDKAVMDTAYDVEIQDNDIIIVGTSVVKGTLATIVFVVRPTFNFGDENASISVSPPIIVEPW